jgi:hypothetical protein
VITTTVDIVAVEVPQGFSYEHLQDQRLRDWAMAAAGTIRSNISGAVQKVLEAGHLLQQAKDRLPHGAYLPWVQQACGLKPQRAAELVKAADWAQMSGIAGCLNGVTDSSVLFLLSADATPEDKLALIRDMDLPERVKRARDLLRVLARLAGEAKRV